MAVCFGFFWYCTLWFCLELFVSFPFHPPLLGWHLDDGTVWRFFLGGFDSGKGFAWTQFQGCCIIAVIKNIAVCYKWCLGHWPPLLHITKYLFMSQGTTQSWNSQGTKAHGGRNPGDVLITGAAWWSARGVVGWGASSRHRGRRCGGWRWKVSRKMNEFLQLRGEEGQTNWT